MATKTLEALNSKTYLEEQSFATPAWTIVHIMDYLSAWRILTVLPLILVGQTFLHNCDYFLVLHSSHSVCLVNLNLPENRVVCEFIFVTFMVELLSET